MALYPFGDKLDKFPSRYVLANLAARRAKEIKEGAPILVQTHSTHPLTIALEEIAEGAVRAIFIEGDVIPVAADTLDSIDLLAREGGGLEGFGDFGSLLGADSGITGGFAASGAEFEDEAISLESLLDEEEKGNGEAGLPNLSSLEISEDEEDLV